MRLYIGFLLVILAVSGPASGDDVWSESFKLESMARYGEAASLLDPLLKKRQPDEFALLRRAWLRYLAGDYSDALRDYKQALQTNPQSLDAQLGMTLPLLAQRRWKEAAGYARQVLRVAPWNYYAHLRLMVAEEGQQQWQTLLKHSQQLHRRYPSDATVLVYSARAQRWLGQKQAAGDSYRQVLQRVPSHIEAEQFLANLR